MADLEAAPVLEAKLQQSKPASLPPRPAREDDLLERYKRETVEVSGRKPTQAQTAEQFDNYARSAVLRAPAELRLPGFTDVALHLIAHTPVDKDFEQKRFDEKYEKPYQAIRAVVQSFSDRTLREVHKDDPGFAMQMKNVRTAYENGGRSGDALKTLAQEWKRLHEMAASSPR